MQDLISRQAAIDAIRRAMCEDGFRTETGLLHEDTACEAIKALPPAQPESEERKAESAQNVPKEDLISRKAAIDAECEVCQIAPKKERGHNCTYYVHGCKEIECLRELPSAQPESDKEQLCRLIRAGIIATNTKDVYSCGMRNGMRWCRSLLDDKEPKFEDASQYAQQERKKGEREEDT